VSVDSCLSTNGDTIKVCWPNQATQADRMSVSTLSMAFRGYWLKDFIINLVCW
jgi:hypothetical protein